MNKLTNTRAMFGFKAVAKGGATGACAPPFQKKKYNMNKQNFDLTFLGKFIY